MSRETHPDLDAFHTHLDYLKLPFIREHYAEFVKEAAAEGADHLALLMRLVEGEAQLRKDRSVERRIRLARFPVRKTLDQFDWTASSRRSAPHIGMASSGSSASSRSSRIPAGSTNT